MIYLSEREFSLTSLPCGDSTEHKLAFFGEFKSSLQSNWGLEAALAVGSGIVIVQAKDALPLYLGGRKKSSRA